MTPSADKAIDVIDEAGARASDADDRSSVRKKQSAMADIESVVARIARIPERKRLARRSRYAERTGRSSENAGLRRITRLSADEAIR